MTMWNDNEICADQLFVGVIALLYGLLANISHDGPSFEDTALLEDLLDFLPKFAELF